jgi:hypothetical protein
MNKNILEIVMKQISLVPAKKDLQERFHKIKKQFNKFKMSLKLTKKGGEKIEDTKIKRKIIKIVTTGTTEEVEDKEVEITKIGDKKENTDLQDKKKSKISLTLTMLNISWIQLIFAFT